MEEPSVLDYVKSKLRLRGGPSLEIPWEAPAEQALAETLPEQLEHPSPEPRGAPRERPAAIPLVVPWRSLLALLIALAGQHSLRPGPDRAWLPGVILLAVSASLLVWANLRGEWQVAPLPQQSAGVDPPRVKFTHLLVGLSLALLSFLSFGVLKFTYFNVALVLLALAFVIAAFWVPPRQPGQWGTKISSQLSALLRRRQWSLSFSASTLLALAAVGLVVFFRFYRLGQVPPEMNSDHAEKILDILRVLDGQTLIFFPTNGGREAFQFYLAAAFHRLLGLELNFMLLKLVTTLVGFLSLPFIYLLGVQVGNRRVAVLAFLFSGIAYWPNVVSRVGLRLPFYILFTAVTLYFLLRGIRNARQNDFLFAGVSLGLSFYGYSANRLLPLLVVAAVGLYLLHSQSAGRRRHTLFSALALVLVSFVLFLPLLRYIIAEPDSFLFRTLTRMGSLERPISEPIWSIFLGNMGRALAMFSWDGGEVWPISIPHHPALGVVAGALFYMGAGLLFLRYLRQRNWLDLFLLLSIPVLLLPSVLALAFPAENPNLYRTGGAMVPVFLTVGIALDGLMTALTSQLDSPWGQRIAWGLALFLLSWSALQNYDLVFNQYYQQYRLSAWNTSEMGQVARDFIGSVGSPDSVWVMGYPHWVDTRLVAVNAGYPGRDYQLFIDQLQATQEIQGPKLFMLNTEDEEAMQALSLLYPQGWFQLYKSKVETKDFLMFFVSPMEGSQP